MGYSSVSFDPSLVALNSDAASSALAEANIASAAAASCGYKISAGARPSATSAVRGKVWYSPGSAGVKDKVEVCCKDAANSYAWRIIY